MKGNVIINLPEKEYKKAPLTIESQIALLKSRWLSFTDEEYAKIVLNRVSYYRLSAYMRFFLGDDRKTFREWTCFKDITDLYNFDSDLKILLLEALEVIEIDFKTQITNTMSLKYWSGFWFMDESKFTSIEVYSNVIWIIRWDIAKNKESSMPIKHYYLHYSTPEFPPCWMLMQIMPFGNVCSVYKSLLNMDKSAIAKRYNVRYQQIESRMVCLAYLRNICAHSDWVWNRNMKKTMTIRWLENYTQNWDVLFTYIIVIAYLFSIINKEVYSIRMKKLIKLITKYTTIMTKVKYMWFPNNWEDLLSKKIQINN